MRSLEVHRCVPSKVLLRCSIKAPSESFQEAIELQEARRLVSRVTVFSPDAILTLKEQLGVSQMEFVHTLGASIESVKSWELVRRQPSGLAVKVSAPMAENPEIYHILAK